MDDILGCKFEEAFKKGVSMASIDHHLSSKLSGPHRNFKDGKDYYD